MFVWLSHAMNGVGPNRGSPERARARGDPAGTAHSGGGPRQLAGRPAPLSGLRPSRRRAPEVPGYRARAPIACFCLSSAPRHLGPRDEYIGWSKEARKANIRFVAYQSRFLILPWVQVPHLASHLLGSLSRRLSSDWERVYAHPIYFTETFVDPSRYRGTCYRAANWTYLGMTMGRGKADFTHKPNRPLKQVLGYPLVKDFRRRLSEVAVGG